MVCVICGCCRGFWCILILIAVKKMSESLLLRGTLRGHNGWVTQVATNSKYPDMILSASRGRIG